jgi:hypothetical protein
MRNYCFILLVFLTGIGCNTKNEEDCKNIAIADTKNKSTNILSTNFDTLMMNFINNSDDNTMGLNFYSVHLSNEDKANNIKVEDSIVYLSKYYCNKDTVGYIGVLKLNGYYVLIFDDSDFGSILYYQKNICRLSIDSFRCLDDKIMYVQAYMIKKDNFINWTPKPVW